MNPQTRLFRQRTNRARGAAQTGAVLIVSLILLATLTILGVTTMQQGSMQERMTSNMRNSDLALQAAEAALRDGEAYVEGSNVPGPFDGSDGLYIPADAEDPPNWESINWDSADAVRTVSVTGVHSDPKYIIERMSNIPFGNRQLAGDEPLPAGAVYRLTARATGQAGKADVMIQSTFRRD